MSMELWQRLKDLEKKVAEQGEEVKSIERRMGAKADVLVTPDGEVRIPVFSPAKGPSLCPKCGKVPGYFFHVKNCKGNAEVA
jgi:hypothetical protein